MICFHLLLRMCYHLLFRRCYRIFIRTCYCLCFRISYHFFFGIYFGFFSKVDYDFGFTICCYFWIRDGYHFFNRFYTLIFDSLRCFHTLLLITWRDGFKFLSLDYFDFVWFWNWIFHWCSDRNDNGLWCDRHFFSHRDSLRWCWQ